MRRKDKVIMPKRVGRNNSWEAGANLASKLGEAEVIR